MYIQTSTRKAVKYAGSKSKLARLLGITRQSVSAWGDELPQTAAQKLYILTDKKIGYKIGA